MGHSQARLSFDYATGSSAFLAADAGNFVLYALNSSTQIGFYNSAGYAFRALANSLNCVVGGSLAQSSDIRYKENVQVASLDACLQIFDRIEVKTYQRNDYEIDKTRIGFIAQDWQEALPPEFQNIVSSSDENEMLGLDYARISCVLWNVCKSLQQRIEAVEGKKKKTTKSK